MVVLLIVLGAACGLCALLRTRSLVRATAGVVALVAASTWVVTEVSGRASSAFFLAALAGMVLAVLVNHRRRLPAAAPAHG